MTVRESSAIGYGPLGASESERCEIERLYKALHKSSPGHSTSLVAPDGEQMQLPESVRLLLQQIVYHLARGDSIAVVPYHQEITTQEAAEILNMSRPSVVSLLDRGEMPYTKTGTHRRVKLHDLLAYKLRRSEMRRESLARITKLSAEMGEY